MNNNMNLVDYDPNDYINDTNLDLYPENYPSYGLYHEIKDIPSAKYLSYKTIEERMKYSDAITRRYAKNKIFLKKQSGISLIEIKNAFRLGKLNGTSLGNLAFVAFHNPENEFFQKVNKVLTTNRKK